MNFEQVTKYASEAMEQQHAFGKNLIDAQTKMMKTANDQFLSLSKEASKIKDVNDFTSFYEKAAQVAQSNFQDTLETAQAMWSQFTPSAFTTKGQKSTTAK